MLLILQMLQIVIANDCNTYIDTVIAIAKKLQPKCKQYENDCNQQNERDIAKMTAKMTFTCLLNKNTKINYEDCIKKDTN